MNQIPRLKVIADTNILRVHKKRRIPLSSF